MTVIPHGVSPAERRIQIAAFTGAGGDEVSPGRRLLARAFSASPAARSARCPRERRPSRSGCSPMATSPQRSAQWTALTWVELVPHVFGNENLRPTGERGVRLLPSGQLSHHPEAVQVLKVKE